MRESDETSEETSENIRDERADAPVERPADETADDRSEEASQETSEDRLIVSNAEWVSLLSGDVTMDDSDQLCTARPIVEQ